MTLAPTIDRPRIGTLREQRPAWSYFLRRRRRRSFQSPLDIAGLKLWLDAGAGLSGVWSPVPASASSWIDYSSSAGYTANNYTHTIRIYPFKTVEGNRVYSARSLEAQVIDDGSAQLYYINWSWGAVADAEGYRVLKADTGSGYNFDFYFDVSGETSFIDTSAGLFTSGASVLPQLPLTMLGAGDSALLWDDQSGLNNHATVATAAALFQPAVVNGRPVLRFASASAGYTTPLVLETPCTVFAVYTLNGAGDFARRAVQGSNNWLLGPYGPVHDFFCGAGFTNGPALTRGVFVAQAAWQDGSASRNFVNGAFVGGTLGPGSGPGTVALGAGGLIAEPLEGDLAEVIAYDSALSEVNLANVWSYLAGKYQLS